MKIVSVMALLALAGVANADWAADAIPVTVTTISDGDGSLRGGALYTANTETGFRSNGGAGIRTMDDIPIPTSTLGGFTRIDVTKITFGIRRITAAPAVDVTGHWAKIVPGSNQSDIGDTINSLGTISLPVNGASNTTLISFGDGSNTLFSVDLRMGDFIPGFGTFAAGVSFSDGNNLNGFRITAGPAANLDAFWNVDGAGNESFLFFGGNPFAQFYIVVEGVGVVPAPGAVGVLGLAGLVASRRRR